VDRKGVSENAGSGSSATPLSRLFAALEDEGLPQALLSSPQTLAHLVGFEVDWENWPVGDPFTAAEPLLLLREGKATLIVPQLFAAAAEGCRCEVVIAPSHRFRGFPIDPVTALAETFGQLSVAAVPTGVEPDHLSLRAAELLRDNGATPVAVEGLLLRARRIKLPSEVEAIRHACRLADTVQATVRRLAEPGQTEAQLAGLAIAEVGRVAGHRVPTVLTLNAGVASAEPSASPGSRVIEAGDIILTDTSPWIDGAWSDTANAVVVGPPRKEHRRLFDDLRRALEQAISLCRPGAVTGEIDRRVRESLSVWGDDVYKHHTGHGIGAFWYEPPSIVPGCTEVIEEGMVLAVEPAVYRPGWGGMRLEHVFRVGADDNEILSEFEHAL
jgi:Xaa-Pro dipeptidase